MSGFRRPGLWGRGWGKDTNSKPGAVALTMPDQAPRNRDHGAEVSASAASVQRCDVFHATGTPLAPTGPLVSHKNALGTAVEGKLDF